MKENYIICIGRQLGSGGKIIGERLAQQLNIGFYDKELLNLAAQESGLDKKFFEHADEKSSGGILNSLLELRVPLVGSSPLTFGSYLNSDSLFKIQSDVIRQLADKQSCIFVGRCADYILRDHARRIDIFISANKQDRIDRLCKLHGIKGKEAEEMIEKGDKKRAAYYNYYSSKTWGYAETYHLCINSSVLGVDETVNFIREFITRQFHL